MPPPNAPSNIRAFVQWREPSVFAGEEIECVITFRNIAAPPGEGEGEGGGKGEGEGEGAGAGAGVTPTGAGLPPGSTGPRSCRVPASSAKAPPSAAGNDPSSRRTTAMAQPAPRPLPARAPSSTHARPARGQHRPTLSLNVVSAPSKAGTALHSAGLHSAPLQSRTPVTTARPGKGHGRSLSIMSLGSGARLPPTTASQTAGSTAKQPARGHARSASLQVSSKPPPPPPLPLPAPNPNAPSASPRQPSPLYESSTPPALPEAPPIRPPRRRPGTVSAGNAPRVGEQRRSPGPAAPDFHFPARQPGAPSDIPKPKRSPSTMHSGQQHRAHSPRPPPEGWSGAGLSNLNPISRVMSESSAGGTPRSSGEFYSQSNHSDETMTSELPYQAQASGRLLPQAPHSRQPSRSRQPKPAEPETLMMAYAQTIGHFTLDGSLVNAAPFEEVKRKGVQGGGGVIGVERSKRASGMFGAFSWGNIGESIGGLLGGDEMSSMAQMKATAGSKTVPLLSTPQNLLFVDLRLAPGEERSWRYRFALPRGLPPSHRGRAIKVAYHLALGVQRPGGGGQAVSHIEIPFRVLGSVNSRGEVLGHDLMAPYILLQDTARSQSIDAAASPPEPLFPPKDTTGKKAKTPKQGLEDFLRYTERLLTAQTDAYGALLSPTSPSSPTSPPSRRSSLAPEITSTKEAIDFALLRANQVSNSTSGQSANKFTIARSGQPVAVLSLLRPAFRLGETIFGTIDFTTPTPAQQAPTYAVLLELESAERVDASLALRSASSIQRVTRKVHSWARDNTLLARRIAFQLTVPSWATPGFETTGVGLVWSLRVEFTVGRQGASVQGDGESRGGGEELLEEVGRDERGVSFLARERLVAESFEIAVPLRIYGARGTEGLGGEVEGRLV